MNTIGGLNPVDYLIIGHITIDITSQGLRMGGTASYAALTAQAMGLQVGIVTAWGEELSPEMPPGITIYNAGAERSSTFELRYTSHGRTLSLKNIAPNLDFYHVPGLWRQAPIVHLAPVVHEINPAIARQFSESRVLLTPQGWLREWDEEGNVRCAEWPEARYILQHSSVVVLSEEDINCSPARLEEFAQAAPILVVTQAERGAKVYLEGQVYEEPAPQVVQVDPTGAGDIFAAAFMVHYCDSGSARSAMRYANQVAAQSVTRSGLDSTPTEEDLYNLPMLGE